MQSRKHAQTRPSPIPIALLLIDVLTTFQFPDGDSILKQALPIQGPLIRLKTRARKAGIPVLYVNDNFGDWRSEREVLIGRCLEAKGADFVRPLIPDSEDYFVLKPMHSAFYMTPLEVLLRHLQIRSLILTGLTSNNCIAAASHDANMRGFEIFVPADCTCGRNSKEHKEAIKHLALASGAHISPSTQLRLPSLIRAARSLART